MRKDTENKMVTPEFATETPEETARLAQEAKKRKDAYRKANGMEKKPGAGFGGVAEAKERLID